MKTAIYSDMHLETGNKIIYNPEAELVIFAGDIDIKARAFEKIRKGYSKQKIVYVNGNHEYYGEHFGKIIEESRVLAEKHDIDFLDNEFIEISGLTFYGGTMWTNFTLHGDPLIGSYLAKENMNDYKKIRVENYRKLYPEFVKREHEKFMAGLKKLVKEDRKIVVISHMAPSIKSFLPGMDKKDAACAYAVNLETFILEHQEKIIFWIHGHIHNSSDYYIGKTQIVTNPMGYFFDLNPNFKENMVIDLAKPTSKNNLIP